MNYKDLEWNYVDDHRYYCKYRANYKGNQIDVREDGEISINGEFVGVNFNLFGEIKNLTHKSDKVILEELGIKLNDWSKTFRKLRDI